MWQYLIVFAVVAIAGIYTIRKLIAQAKGSGCDGCHCTCHPEPRKTKK